MTYRKEKRICLRVAQNGFISELLTSRESQVMFLELRAGNPIAQLTELWVLRKTIA